MLAVFLLSISSVCASEIDNTIASDYTDSTELSSDNVDENLQITEKNDELSLTDNNDTLSVKNDVNVLGDSFGTYSGLKKEIGSGETLNCNTIIILMIKEILFLSVFLVLLLTVKAQSLT